MKDKVKILYIDDEKQNLTSFRANFKNEYQVFTAENAADGFKLLMEHEFPVIIADQRMPLISGVEFLEQTTIDHPDSIRLLLTGYSDIQTVIEAINRGQVSKYLQKPWDIEKLSMAIDHCITLYNSKAELKKKNLELQIANEELNRFVYSISHDIRSPLTSVLGIINLTHVMPELKEAQPYFEMIKERVDHLDGFVKKLIDYYKNSRSEDSIELIEIRTLINETHAYLHLDEKSIEFACEIDQQSPFYGDPYRLGIVFDNLLSNSIKYRDPEKPKLQIRLEIIITTQKMEIKISDNGIGIEEKHLNKIFNLFYRAEDSLKKSGSGIGLYIVKEAIKHMRGQITVESKINQGTIFNITIPNNLKNDRND